MPKSAPNSRPVHPCYLSAWDGAAGAEHSCWASITGNGVPDLVTAQASTLVIYKVHQRSGKLLEVLSFPHLSGNVCFLEALHVEGSEPDSLLVGFSGHPRLSIVSVSSSGASEISPSAQILSATSLLDLTTAILESAVGAISPLEQDLCACVLQKKNVASVAVVLGGGVSVVCLTIRHVKEQGWISDEPHVLSLKNLSKSLNIEKTSLQPQAMPTARDYAQTICTGFGDILHATFLAGYLEPTLLLLHSNPLSGGWTCPGRLGRPNDSSGTRHGLYVTACSVTVAHQRSAILWSVEVPADALSMHTVGEKGSIVVCSNSIISVDNSGQIQQCLAVNGWAKATLSAQTVGRAHSNPWPFPKLAIQMDGAKVSPVNDQAFFVALRSGHLYLLQWSGSWCMLPLYHVVGGIGEVANLISWQFQPEKLPVPSMVSKFKTDYAKHAVTGLMFVGSRMGDSSLMTFGIEECSSEDVESSIKKEKSDQEDNSGIKIEATEQQDPDIILQLEEDALYTASSPNDIEITSNIVLPSDDDSTAEINAIATITKTKRLRLSRLLVVKELIPLDSLISLGQLGPACEGPIAASRFGSKIDGSVPPLGANAYVMPCGYGSSGGLALLTAPGRDDRLILSEGDCVNGQALLSLPNFGVVLLCMDPMYGGSKVLKIEADSRRRRGEDGQMESIYTEMLLDDWLVEGDMRAKKVLSDCTLLGALELTDDSAALIASFSVDEKVEYVIAILETVNGEATVADMFEVPIPAGESITSLSRLLSDTRQRTYFGFVTSSGNSSLLCFDADGNISTANLKVEVGEGSLKVPKEDEDDENEEAFYGQQSIVATDLFYAPDAFFKTTDALPEPTSSNGEGNSLSHTDTAGSLIDNGLSDDDDDVVDLYEDGVKGAAMDAQTRASRLQNPKGQDDDIISAKKSLFFAICRQSGSLEIYDAIGLLTKKKIQPLWKCLGCGHGTASMRRQQGGDLYSTRKPKMQQVYTGEMKFFFSGPSSSVVPRKSIDAAPFCMALVTNLGDTFLYTAVCRDGVVVEFDRVQLQMVSRPSQEQGRHYAKLRRKKIVSDPDSSATIFRRNRLHPFQNISGQDGLFAAVARPVWYLAERGKLRYLVHRSQHAAPAGGRPQSVTAFCSDIRLTPGKNAPKGFMTLHERVGRVGSQRLTVFRETVKSDAHGLMVGGGVFLEKVPLGVTVRHIEFINDRDVSTEGHPLYAVLVSRELDSDQSGFNEDGLTGEERKKLDDEKEGEKIKRQVEADLGGFDIEQEWVEEIEREDCFKVDTSLGGAPPIPRSAYSLWVVDAANKWNVVDSFELNEDEHALTMQVMTLTEFNVQPGVEGSESVMDEDLGERLFITVGTGIVDKNGEDVSSKGRVLLFSVEKVDAASALGASQIAELSMVYEKDVFHGPVTTLSCLVNEGKNRLVVGAGADVNVEQWGNDKLLQIGFFRATMQVLEIKIMKNFLILSDAYDSLYFLIWRESDKSLTLLAKDYDPIPVHAAGVMSRGGSLALVCHDDRQNLQFFHYAPGDAAARGGNKLVCKADFHLGTQTSSLQNHFCNSSVLINSATPSSTISALKQQDALFGRTDDDQRLGIHFGTIDGGLGTVTPLSEPVYWRLTALQSVMVNAMEGGCALSQQAWRLYRRSFRRGGCRTNTRKKGVIDGDLVVQYADLATPDQEDLASAIGSTVELILDNILELRCASMIV